MSPVLKDLNPRPFAHLKTRRIGKRYRSSPKRYGHHLRKDKGKKRSSSGTPKRELFTVEELDRQYPDISEVNLRK